jgi:hypothetical protein
MIGADDYLCEHARISHALGSRGWAKKIVRKQQLAIFLEATIYEQGHHNMYNENIAS